MHVQQNTIKKVKYKAAVYKNIFATKTDKHISSRIYKEFLVTAHTKKALCEFWGHRWKKEKQKQMWSKS